MRKILQTAGALAALVWLVGAASVVAEQGMRDRGPAAQSDITITVPPYMPFVQAAHVANGVALRNRTAGTIHLRGVPVGSTVLKAYLYWNFSDSNTVGAATSPALFNGNLVKGTKTADSADPCWGMTGNHSYRADVTIYVPNARPNEDYDVNIDYAATTSTTGQHPWAPGESQIKRLEGATLLVVYRASGRAVVIYDALSGTMFFNGTLTLILPHPVSLSGVGLMTMSGADGQRGVGHDNGASNETGFFNGIQISGPPIAASDWDGSTGLPLPQLWDVHTHQVEIVNPNSTVSWVAGPDCLVPVVIVLEAHTP